MAGWNLKFGELKDQDVSEDRYWTFFNYVFSDSSKKRNTYKFGLIKSILDNLFNGTDTVAGFYISYYDLFAKFTENYWNLIVKYDLRQMRKDARSEFSGIEIILKAAVQNNIILENLEFESIDSKQKELIIKNVAMECKRCVVGALYEDFDGTLYSFVLADQGLYLSYNAYEFMLKLLKTPAVINPMIGKRMNETVRVLKTPKTDSSVRKVFLPKSAARMLIEWKEKQNETKEILGDEYLDYNMVMASTFGLPLGDGAIRKPLNQLIKEHNLPPVVFHSLRYSSVAYKLKLNGGDIKAVQGDSGHAQVSMVTDVYSHILDDDRKKNAELLAKVLSNPEMAPLLTSLAKTMK